MSLSEELERLARLHARGELTQEEFARAKGRLLASPSRELPPQRSIRRQSQRSCFGLPLWSIAIGPDLERGERRGHARGIVALGDIATGWLAIGGLARGIVALGGLAVGLVSAGGCSIGVLLAIGGAAAGGIAFGGAAVGLVAIGGGAFGYYALGGGAAGAHTLSAMSQDPAAVEFFREHFPALADQMRH